ncbi:UDP-glucose 4-epimerase GalE [Thermoflexus sp.]|uniref:UDP-glucose 4-epimerase GalE n=1 Tax=Thermoflexus sp. TaxID=1969742 RepID=UPI0025DDE8B4|nr:UDP-glucose 4-epimerase GalE [Thermoflexus sp.]MDW8181002.1 UDP-glucose 4-epimerase GalE [Anaerolineae bacterium]MCS6963621.1 UDP-glucose 4-epimerase GalE [Thermoflexus sp.]MCS7351544.1 UDP-glucose 4-epimerase GalE [Thermoflexus sp.]MCX7691327.1 UDP-glucose 4-epimerase GalE [Thermoflexus sp.]MDW8184770.1 UDP-glucose 4-epimerase GalE [Anaerolineae bacterium]
MRILVAGGAGYIGSIVAEFLLNAGYEVVVYDNLSHGFRAAVPEGALFVQGDIGDGERVVETLRRWPCQAAMHFAAFIEAGESMQDPFKYLRNNIAQTIAFLEALLAAGVDRMVFSSTAAVYAPTPEPLTESSPIGPTNVYGETKATVERILMWLHRTRGLRYAALRYFNAGGATATRGEDHRPESHLIPNILAVALGRRPYVEIYGTDYPTRDGTCVRDYVHVVDLARAHLLALEALSDRPVMVYNVGTGVGYTVREVLKVCREVTGHPIPAVEAPRRPGDPVMLVASPEAIRRDLGWTPQYTLRDIVLSAWRWMQDHPEGYSAQAISPAPQALSS